MVCMNAALLHNKASGVVRRTLGVGPSKQLPCPLEGQQHSAQSSAALSSDASKKSRVHLNKVKSELDLALHPVAL